MPVIVSVIVVVYNNERFLPYCLSSLVNLDFPKDSFEIIIVDNNSTDNTKNIIQGFPVRYVFEKNRSPASARNAGLKEAKGQYIAFLDSDGVADRFWLKNLVESFKKDSFNIGFAKCSCKMEEKDKRTFWQQYYYSTVFLNNLDFHSNESEKHSLGLLDTDGLVFRREIFDEVGLFDINLLRNEDSDLGLRIFLRGYKSKFTPEARVSKKDHQSFLRYLRARIIDGQCAAKVFYKYQRFFAFKATEKYVNSFRIELMRMFRKFNQAIKNNIFNPLFMVLDFSFFVIENLSLLIGLAKGRRGIKVLSKSSISPNKFIASIKITMDNKILSYNNNVLCAMNNMKETIFIDKKSMLLYTLESTGKDIWELIVQGKTIPEIANEISLKNNMDLGIVKDDLEGFLCELKENNILIEA